MPWGKTARAPSRLKAAGHPGLRLRSPRVRPCPSPRGLGQVQCPGGPLPWCLAPPQPVSPQRKTGVKAGQPGLEGAAGGGARPQAGHGARGGGRTAAILPPRARSSRPCRRPPSPAPPLPSPPRCSLATRSTPPPQLGLLAQSPWELDSSGLGTDLPSLAFSLLLALGGGGEDFGSWVATLESQCPAPLA